MQPVSNYFAKSRAAIAIQASYRGYAARKYTVLPGDIQHLCENSGHVPWMLAILLCREANRYLEEMRFTEAKSPKTINGWEKRKICFNPWRTNRIIHARNIPTFYIKWLRNALYLIFPSENESVIAVGPSKTFLPATTIRIPLSAQDNYGYRLPCVLIQPTKDIPFLEETINVHRAYFDHYLLARPKGVYLAEATERVGQNLYFQGRFEKSLDTASPASVTGCLEDVTKTIFWLHENGALHGKVKMSNILIGTRQVNGVERPVAHLNDFDMTETIGARITRKRSDNPYWDVCGCGEIHTPFMDFFGLACLFLQTKLPNITEEAIVRVRENVLANVKRRKPMMPLQYWNLNFNHAILTNSQRKIWKLFITICLQSSHLYLRLPSTGAITHEQIEAILKKEDRDSIQNQFLEIIEKLKQTE